MIRFHNTATRRIEDLVPISPPRIGLYTCGPTVHDHAHIGNFRTFTWEDLLRRFLEFCGYEVFHVMNITDVDDKTIRKAAAKGATLSEYTAPYTEGFLEDIRTLRFCPAHVYPRATEHIPEMIALIERLVERGFAYESGGSIYFRIAAFPEYGRLSGVSGRELKIGKFPFSASGRALAAGEPDGFVKLIFDAKYGELLGVHMIGENVTDMLSELVMARKLEATEEEIIDAIHPHPTYSEAIMEAAGVAYGKAIHL